jgi:hypothetical protein
VVATLGPPTRAYALGPLRRLVYERSDVWSGRRTGFGVPPLGPGFDIGKGFPAVNFSCRVTFTLEAGHVRSFDRTGSGCT